MAVELTDGNFQELAIDSGKTVMVDFWAEWCGPCRMVGPIVEEISNEVGDGAVVGKVNVDHNPAVAGQYGIRNIPTIIFLKNGELVDKQVGVASKQALMDKLNAAMA